MVKKVKEKRWRFLPVLLAAIVAISLFPLAKADAAGLNLYFGSQNYTVSPGESFQIGVYLDTDDGRIGDYRVELGYNPLYLDYLSGADNVSNGTITLSGSGQNRMQVKYLLKFRALAGGGTSLWFTSATANDTAGNALEVAPTENGLPIAPISITPAESTLLDSITVGGTPIEGFDPYLMNYSISVSGDTEVLDISASGPGEISTSNTALAVGDNHIYITSTAGNRTGIYDIYVNRPEPQAAQMEIDTTTTDSTAGDTSAETAADNPMSMRIRRLAEIMDSDSFTFVVIALNVLIVLVLVLAVVLRRQRYEREERKRKAELRKEAALKKKQQLAVLNLDNTEVRKTEWEDQMAVADMEHLLRHEAPVIEVQDVCMDFRISTQNVSGIKELLIQAVKGKVSYRNLAALSHVTFNVYKGEVVGIIGTNGSGKSTLMKLVSGAMNPTSGRIVVDQRKVQLLTLGTGFDMELTAHENVYLNGAIIGYSKKFIDEHYDSIVKFAELEGFMEEKVKNFSSGMVSRLGFAIATAEDAPEILLLDEVLSVGDEFFRKKSLKRIKEMIHGGSTVLMVSHGMGTILENCTKVVWIEKGVPQRIGSPKEVCAAYRKQKEA